ncbi:MAG: NADPH-dependent F420 reductase [Actinoallomurus sp.]
MTTAVIGAGFIGGTLGRAFASAGITTVLGSRTPGHHSAASTSGATVTTIEKAISVAQTVLLALPASAMEDFLRTHGDALTGRLVIDATNSLAGPVAHHAQAVATHAPKARYARAFNTLGGENLADPDFAGTPADLFYSCDPDDRPVLEELITAVGLHPMYLGENQHDTVDGVLRLWFALAIGQGHGRHLAFHTLTR